ncbi:helix-turn-helix domain-containing protein [Dyadobacter sp. CY345]|uniref:helix-turn-helix transcriptional regulator n=1 Tax=Dyadobacter sp. CY345 TaxID=2909335 RepID=UPI001F202D29|nr:helix-turn-helix transcriptional regulator [Dyadobacter sp. CY345]MCF2446512.1 helix-turn-helix domain-containing protein [Dyadobacter sp. CY345]
MDLNEKIKQILVDKNISPSHFADEIGIQRSSISHIIAGRNKPSLDIVQKIIKRFPDLGINWILEDEELPESISEIKPFKADNYTTFNGQKSGIASLAESRRNNLSNQNPGHQNVVSELSIPPANEKKVERILIFYSDGTFQEFK